MSNSASKDLSYTRLARRALRLLGEAPEEKGRLIQICGPISTGGCGSVEGNLIIFKNVIACFIESGYSLFDQMPYEQEILRIKEDRRAAGLFEEYDDTLLEEFYRPIFASGYIGCVVFMPDYKSSRGALWEKDRACEYDIATAYLPEDWNAQFVFEGKLSVPF